MKISGFTIVKNSVQFNYPAKEAIASILPICDEFVVNVGESDDNTLEIIESINSPKIKIYKRKWDHSVGEEVLSVETNFALDKCKGDWCFYVQTDEVVHENDLRYLKKCMKKHLNDEKIEGFKLRWFHFYGSYWRYRVDPPWFQKQIRIVRNNKNIESYSGAWSFRRKNKEQLNTIKVPSFIYHYGWVNNPETMTRRRENAANIGFEGIENSEKEGAYNYGDLSRFPVYFGTHPKVMKEKVLLNNLSQKDWQSIKRKYFWSPFLWFRPRYKTFLRPKKSIPR